MYVGEDTSYYLAKGAKVVEAELNSEPAKFTYKRFINEIKMDIWWFWMPPLVLSVNLKRYI